MKRKLNRLETIKEKNDELSPVALRHKSEQFESDPILKHINNKAHNKIINELTHN